MKIGIIFGGPSREREIAFAGGRTIYDNLNKSLFEPIPIFVDSLRNFILLDWEYVYKGTIRDFYPPISHLPKSPNEFQIYIESLKIDDKAHLEELIQKVGRKIEIQELPQIMEMAFLSLHGNFGEDGQIQGLLESLQIPYTGSGIRACSIGMDKAYQKKLMNAGGFDCPIVEVISKAKWKSIVDYKETFKKYKQKIGFPMVIRPANQGSSIGVSIIDKDTDLMTFVKLCNRAFFIEKIDSTFWNSLELQDKISYIRELTDIRSGIGFPLDVNNKIIFHPEELLTFLNEYFQSNETSILLESHHSEQQIILEEFIHGKEFSCIVTQLEDGRVVALPPTEIIKGNEVFDYRSKYLPGLSRKLTPINLPDKQIQNIRYQCVKLFNYLEFNVYARIDGFITNDGTIFLNDPNTTSGMLPSSFFFHQAAEIGLNPSQFLTYIIRTSLRERINTSLEKTHFNQLLNQLDNNIQSLKTAQAKRKKIAVFLGGYSFERHISVESGRNVFEKLASSDKYEPIPIFVLGDSNSYNLYQIPINLLLKDNADDIRDKILNFKQHPIIEFIKKECHSLTHKYASKDVVFSPKKISYAKLKDLVEGVFIGLHGRPGEDGTVQKDLDKWGIYYNGSGYDSSQITINKYETLQQLKKEGFVVTEQLLSYKSSFLKDKEKTIQELQQKFKYPFILKPVDDGCSSAVKVIKNQAQLLAYMDCMYRETEALPTTAVKTLGLSPKEEFPQKDVILVEQLIQSNGAKHFLEITGGLLTHHDGQNIKYELFEPSEALAGGEILSLEEKFLAGEGQNITPARFANNQKDYAYIAGCVKETLKKAAKVLKVKGYARIDAFVRIFDDGKVETIIIEVNSLPGMTPATCIFHQAAINNYKPYQFIDKILEFGFYEQNKKLL